MRILNGHYLNPTQRLTAALPDVRPFALFTRGEDGTDERAVGNLGGLELVRTWEPGSG